MDNIKLKISKYQEVLKKYIYGLVDEYNSSLGSDKNYHAIIDLQNNHFQFVKMGWSKGRFSYGILIHLSIHPETGNIWIQQNNTEILIDIDLEHLANVPKTHIVLGTVPDDMREHSEYAVA